MGILRNILISCEYAMDSLYTACCTANPKHIEEVELELASLVVIFI